MVEIKIRFKNGLVGNFKLPSERYKINDFYNFLKEKMLSHDAILELIDTEDNKNTLIRLSDISTFGYSE